MVQEGMDLRKKYCFLESKTLFTFFALGYDAFGKDFYALPFI